MTTTNSLMDSKYIKKAQGNKHVLCELRSQKFITLQQPHILVVDDNSIVRQFHKNILLKLNCRVTLASCGAEALQQFHYDQHFDAIFMDMDLGDSNGVEVAKIIRAHNAVNDDIPLVFVTTHPLNDLEQTYVKFYLRKPISLKTVDEMLIKIFSIYWRRDASLNNE